MKANSMFGALLVIIGQVLASRENTITIPNTESWITTDNFTMMINKSFIYSKCCNIYLSDSIHSVEAIFKQFINIYPYDYLLRKKIYDCQGYLLLGSTDKEIEEIMQNIPSSIPTAEILIIIDSELSSNSELFNVTLYGNANANVVSKFGIWTLSENYLEPRFFLKVDTYEELAYEFDIINLRGRELQVCAFYRPPFTYIQTTTKKIINGVEEEVFPVNNDVEFDGVEVKIFLLIAEKLNFTWTIRKPQGEYRYGRPNGTEWNGGVIQLLREKKIDLAFSGIWLTKDHNAYANMSEPWYELFIHFLVPRPKPVTSFWALTRPFPLEGWLLLILALFMKSIYMYVRARIDPKFPKRFRSFLSTITELIGRLLGTWVPRNTANARLELHLWHSAGVVLVTAYSSSLASRLTNWEYEDRIDTVRQFIEANLSWGRKGKEPPYYDYFDLDDPYSGQLPSRFISIKNDDETHNFIEKGKYAIIGRIVGSLFFPEDEIASEDLKIMLWLRESGIISFHLNDVIYRRANSNLYEVLKEYDGLDGVARILGLVPLGAGFITLILGLLISTIVFVYELKQAAGSRKIYEVLRTIQKKRETFEQSAHKSEYPEGS